VNNPPVPSTRRLLFITSSLGQGGAERMLFALLRDLDHAQFKATVISLRSGGVYAQQLRDAGITVQEYNFKLDYSSIIQFTQLNRLARETKPDLVIGWMYHGNLVASIVGAILRTSVIWNVRHALGDPQGDRWSTRILIRASALFSRYCQRVIFNSSRSMQAHIKIGYSATRSIMIANGIETARFVQQHIGQSRAQLRVPVDAKVVGLVARVHPVKDHGTFLRAMVAVRQAIPELWIVLVGLDTDGPAIRAQLIELGIADRCSCLGARIDTEQIYPALDLLCSSSRSEGFPNVIAEAMACGVLCVATNAGESAEITGKFGAIVEVGDAESMSSQVQRLLRLSPEVRKNLGHQARNQIMDRFSLRKMIAAYSSEFSTDQ